jgi:hypothetical protein
VAELYGPESVSKSGPTTKDPDSSWVIEPI